MTEVWIIEDDLRTDGKRGIVSVWADDKPAIREVERLREEHGRGFSVFCHQVRSDQEQSQ